jgi:hypothetical protein
MGLHSRRQDEASYRHDAANAMASAIAAGTRSVVAVCDGEWSIRAAVGNAVYRIIRQRCKRICMVSGFLVSQRAKWPLQIACKCCGVCPHEFLCDCPDALCHSWACKHSHLLAMMFGCRESDEATTDMQLHVHAVEEADGIVESREETVNAQAEFESIDDDDCSTAKPASSTLEDYPEMAAASRAVRQSLEKFDEMLVLPIPASFNEQQHDTTLSLVNIRT